MSDIGTTTPALVKADFITQILAISPSAVEHKDKPWSRARSVGEVEGAEIRTFHMENLPDEEHGELGWDDAGRSVQYETAIWTSYAALNEEDDDSIISEDSNQLHNAFVRRLSPTLAGLIMVERVGWDEGSDSEDGGRWGAHMFLVTYMASNTV